VFEDVSQFPLLGEIQENMGCSLCQLPAEYPFLMCDGGHLICCKNVSSLKDCPAKNEEGSHCNEPLMQYEMKWCQLLVQAIMFEHFHNGIRIDGNEISLEFEGLLKIFFVLVFHK